MGPGCNPEGGKFRVGSIPTALTKFWVFRGSVVEVISIAEQPINLIAVIKT